jgi:hypothetical protein
MDLDRFVQRLREDFDLDLPQDAAAHDDLYDTPGFTSLEAYELLLATEELAGADAPPIEAPPLRTLADAFAYYELLRDATPAGR